MQLFCYCTRRVFLHLCCVALLPSAFSLSSAPGCPKQVATSRYSEHAHSSTSAFGCFRPKHHTWHVVCPSMPPLFEGLFPKVATTQSQLVDYLVKEKLVKTPAVERVMRAVDRRNFVEPSTPKGEVYQDAPLPLGHGQTISAPHMHAIALELLSSKLVPEARALDVGSGSGYLTACMAQLVAPGGSVLGLEKVWQLVHRSRESIRSWHPELAASGALRIEHANALSEALEGCEACYHAIHVGAAAEELPKSLVDRLCPQGRMVVPVGPRGMAQTLLTVDKDASGQVHIEQQMGVAYVPLTHPGEDDWRNQG